MKCEPRRLENAGLEVAIQGLVGHVSAVEVRASSVCGFEVKGILDIQTPGQRKPALDNCLPARIESTEPQRNFGNKTLPYLSVNLTTLKNKKIPKLLQAGLGYGREGGKGSGGGEGTGG